MASGAPIVAGSGGRGTEISIGVSVAGLDSLAAFDYVGVLEAWEKDWRKFFGLTPYGEASARRNTSVQPDKQLPGIVTFLLTYVDQAASNHPAFAEFVYETKGLLRVARQAVNESSEVRWRVPCPAVVPGEEEPRCGHVLFVSKTSKQDEVVCKKCETVWGLDRLVRVVLSDTKTSVWLDPGAASLWLGVTPRDLRRMAQKGKINRKHGQYDLLSIEKEDAR